MNQNKRRFWKGLLIVLAVLFMFALADHLRRKWRMESYKAELVKQGMIFDPPKLSPTPVPDAENAATLLNTAMAQLNTAPLTNFQTITPLKYEAPGRARVEWRFRTHDRKELPIDQKQLVDVVERNQTVLDDIRRAAQRPHMDQKLDYSQTYELPLPHLANLSKASRWLMARVMVHLQYGRVSAAIADLEAVLSLTSMLRDEPLVISQYYAFWIERDAMEVTWGILQAEGLRSADLKRVQELWLKPNLSAKLEAAVLMEQWMALKTIREARESIEAYDKYLDHLLPGVRKPFSHKLFDGHSFQSWAIDIDWLIRDTVQIVSDGAKRLRWKYYASYDEERVICESTMATLRTLKSLSNGTNAYQILKDFEPWSREIFYHLSANPFLDSSSYSMITAIDNVIPAESIRRLAGTAVALKRYQLIHGEWPETLEVMVPEFLTTIPTDPGDGQPLRYRRQGDNEFLLYTLGDNGKDDGGEAVREDGTSVNPRFRVGKDWVWPMPVQAMVEEQTAAP